MHRAFPDPQTGLPDPDRIELGALKLAAGSDPAKVAASLQARLPDDVVVLTKPELAARIRAFWRKFQPIGAVFGLGAAIGFVIGVVVCYQVLFTDITDHYPQFATLKAMGYRDSFLVRVVMQKASSRCAASGRACCSVS